MVVDDNEIIREGIVIALDSSEKYQIINVYPDGQSAISNFKKDDPDIVLMDMELPDMSGLKCIEKIKSIKRNVDVLVITVHEDSDLVFKALEVGAIGYITKSSVKFFTDLENVIDEMVSGGSPMSTAIARMVVNSFQKNTRTPLSKRETKVLELLARGKSYRVIADELFIAGATVRAHIRNIYEKLQVNSKDQAIEKALMQKLIR